MKSLLKKIIMLASIACSLVIVDHHQEAASAAVDAGLEVFGAVAPEVLGALFI